MSNTQVDVESPVLRRTAAAKYLGISIASLHRLINRREFVPAIKLGEQSIGFFRKDLDAWLEKRTIRK